MSEFDQRFFMFGDQCAAGPSSSSQEMVDSPPQPMTLQQMLGETFQNMKYDSAPSPHQIGLLGGLECLDGMGPLDFGNIVGGPMDMGITALRNSTKTLKCPKCNWHYKYQETLEIHMKEKHSETEVKCLFCVENRAHPKLARGESYSCGYKPYRCELCKYSTTTKGNLSIHMQSDKHLHAVQELPNSIANLSVPGGTSRSPILEGSERTFLCGVCGNYTTDSLAEVIAHAEKDRSRPGAGDVSSINGMFRCHLCPYHTNLKANFQLHTRTDKHIQRIQMINHVREGAPNSAHLARLATAKSAFQVLCRPCQEVFTSPLILREHCESAPHRCMMRQPMLNFECRLCNYATPHRNEAIGHLSCHEPSTWQISFPIDEEESSDAVTMQEDTAFACAGCQFTSKDQSELEEHAKTHELGEQCPLCSDRPHVLTDHLIQEHKIAESAVERLLSVHRADIAPVTGVQFAFRCSKCSLAFRTESALQSHSLSHVFRTENACPTCGYTADSPSLLTEHMSKEHPTERDEERIYKCDLCVEQFPSKQLMLSHLNSVGHLHKAKAQLEQHGAIDLNAQVLASLNAPGSPSDRKPFRCNVCKIGYGQGTTLDIHLRSVAHQSRMGKIAELVSSGDVDASKPVLEQPGGVPQRLIRELLGQDESSSAQQNAMAMLNNFLNMAQLLQMAGGSQSGGMPANIQPSTSTSDSDDETSPKTGSELRQIVENYGLEQLPDVVQQRLERIDEIPDEKCGEIARVDCEICGQSCNNIVSLRSHCEESHQSSIPGETIERFVERLSRGIEESDGVSDPVSRSDSRAASVDNTNEPPEKRARTESSGNEAQAAQLALLNMMGAGFPFMPPNPFMQMEMFNPMMAQQMAALQAANNPAKRARTRITDDQLKVLRTYFDINNSPSEAQIHEMSLKTQLPEKVIKHWFRNTLFKERQRDKDSPYNFSIPPQMGIDLDTYEKTGEAKVVSINNQDAAHVEVKKEIKEEVKETVSPPTPSASSSNAANLAQLIGNIGNLQHANPFSFMQGGEKTFGSLLGGALPQMQSQMQSQSGGGGGRRANRTRFTDFQLRTLQQFFDKQAYPKDDDLELLSKKLQLSPRVIVVWFQNARQKVRTKQEARKIYENQPNHENSERFVKTPGCNFQCKRCQLVFQRYYELIQHQQKKCYKDDCQAQLNDNRLVEESLNDEERQSLALESSRSAQISIPTPNDILKLLGQGKSSTEALLKMCESSARPAPAPFHKRCPFCCLLFRSRQAMVEHLPLKHAEQILRVSVDVDQLPSADDVPSLSSALCQEDKRESIPLDLSSGSYDRGDSLSVSPFLGGSDGDDISGEHNSEDIFAAFSGSSSQPGSARSPANNKRYRTHLTPMQVHVMKCIFIDYKTPSMSECELLGRDIGLHKRVVQVWFQNARAKERKHRAQNGQDEDLTRSTATSCSQCGVEYTSRLTMQDHLFSIEHLSLIRSLHKGEPGEAVEQPRVHDENGMRSRNASSLRETPKKSCTPLNAPNFPFNFMNFAGIQPGALPMMYDPSVMGTPIPLLQIPESVMTQITSDMASGKTSTKFTQDGLTFEDLVENLTDDDVKCVVPKNCEVGWACTGCSNVFQQESLLKNHQRAICTGSDGVFTLIQTHYECIACGSQFGSQTDYRNHIDSPEHLGAKAALLPVVSLAGAISSLTGTL